MNQKQRDRWERTRSKGKWHFVSVYGVGLFGGLMVVVTSVFNMVLGTFAYGNLFRHTLPLCASGGVIFGLTTWFVGEYMYSRARHSTPQSRQ